MTGGRPRGRVHGVPAAMPQGQELGSCSVDRLDSERGNHRVSFPEPAGQAGTPRLAGSMPDALAEAADLISRGKLHLTVEKSYLLADAAAAHVDSQAGHARGRRVVIV
jgi:NADPH:quinone reductase-like Zn-dependent oxidoreductase